VRAGKPVLTHQVVGYRNFGAFLQKLRCRRPGIAILDMKELGNKGGYGG